MLITTLPLGQFAASRFQRVMYLLNPYQGNGQIASVSYAAGNTAVRSVCITSSIFNETEPPFCFTIVSQIITYLVFNIKNIRRTYFQKYNSRNIVLNIPYSRSFIIRSTCTSPCREGAPTHTTPRNSSPPRDTPLL